MEDKSIKNLVATEKCKLGLTMARFFED